MGCLTEIILFPIKLMIWFFQFFIYLFIFIINVIFGGNKRKYRKKTNYKRKVISKVNYEPAYRNWDKYNDFNDSFKNEITKRNNNTVKTQNAEFEKEAKLWGLNYNDSVLAKREGMSPADYIEAEERDDDNLDTDG